MLLLKGDITTGRKGKGSWRYSGVMWEMMFPRL